LDLDGERTGDAARSECSDQWFSHAEIGKSVVSSNFWFLSASDGEIAGGQHRSPRYEVCWGTNHLGMKKRFTTRWQAR
jgi:hypothetical protein